MPKRQKSIILYSNGGYNFFVGEVWFISFGLSLLAVLHFKYHWAISILTTILLVVIILALFQANRIARYLITGFFIIIWGILGYSIGATFEPNSKFSVLGFVLAIVFALAALGTHINAFEWMANIDDRR